MRRRCLVEAARLFESKKFLAKTKLFQCIIQPTTDHIVIDDDHFTHTHTHIHSLYWEWNQEMKPFFPCYMCICIYETPTLHANQNKLGVSLCTHTHTHTMMKSFDFDSAVRRTAAFSCPDDRTQNDIHKENN